MPTFNHTLYLGIWVDGGEALYLLYFALHQPAHGTVASAP